MNNKVKTILIIVMSILILLGIGLIFYPIISSVYTESVRSEVKSEYVEELNNIDTSEIDAARQAAIEYNRRLFSGYIDILDPESTGYYEQLNITNNGIMGYIDIPSINVNLPIFHGVGDDSLTTGTGHMPQTSLPVGGENTRCVISAHTGSASSAMFTDLPNMQIGDYFYLEVLGQTLAYQILETEAVPDPITTVLPEEVNSIKIIRGEDLVTLVTCTPYGINSHRLLVTGTRVDMPDEDIQAITPNTENNKSSNSSIWMQEYMQGVYLSLVLALVFVLFIIMIVLILVITRKKKELAGKKLRKAGGTAHD